MHGQQNAWQSHLPRLRAHGIHGEVVPDCGHFPMDVKPVHTWRAIAGFHADSGKAS
jgi:pimeloyl-ACP methyl ester carboxylesterase